MRSAFVMATVCRASGGPREVDQEPAPRIVVGHRHLAAVRLDDALDDGEPEAGATAEHPGGVGSPGPAALPGHVERALQVLLGEAAAPVGDRELDPVRTRSADDLHDAVGG